MKNRGVIYKKRTYVDNEKQKVTDILFIEVTDKIKINDDLIKIIPIISDHPSSYCIGEEIEVNGEVSLECILTPAGKRSISLIPVFRTSHKFNEIIL
ncbi:MAG: hypothetical protein Q8912_02325 [Bacillota bacterium]|nr:hypothetical protein [Bacillota bacterium]